MWSIVLGVGIVVASFLVIGLSGRRQRRPTADDYLTASREVHPWLVGFAAAATNSSGFMFIGLIGATVTDGLSSMWLMVGWIVGDYLAWLVIHRRLRERVEELRPHSVAGYVSAAGTGHAPIVRMLIAGLTIVFLATYAAAQFTAGSKGLEALLGWPRSIGVLIGFGLLLLYCFGGGLRSSIRVNALQSLVMIGSVLLLLAVAVWRIGGLAAVWSQLRALDPKYVAWEPQGLKFGFAGFMVSWIAAGAGVIGQPHIMTIAMSIDSSTSMHRARRVYFAWYWVFSAACILVGLCCRVWLNDAITAGFDPEMALPQLASELLPGVLVGVILGGLFSATLSTADTQIICASAALTQDLAPRWGATYSGARTGMLAVACGVALIALSNVQSVFALVVLSWSCLAAGIGPILAAQTLRWPLNDTIGSAMIIAGVGTALFWRYGLKLSDSIYEVLPGMLAGFATYGIARLCRPVTRTSSTPSPVATAAGERA